MRYRSGTWGKFGARVAEEKKRTELTFRSKKLSNKFIWTLNIKTLVMENIKTWHDMHKQSSTFGQKLADSVASGMGSWRFIIIQTIIVILWMAFNVIAFVHHWDVYP